VYLALAEFIVHGTTDWMKCDASESATRPRHTNWCICIAIAPRS
jgi:hypothetical protein